jgi:hypothetical protein
MAIFQRNGKWYSDLLPHAEFQAELEARTYDRRASQQMSTSRAQAEEALKGLSTEQVRVLAKATTAIAADNNRRSQQVEEAELFGALVPDLVQSGEKGVHNSALIAGFLRAQGILQPTAHDMKRAYEDLKDDGQLYLKTRK